jgi:hypothetical protein
MLRARATEDASAAVDVPRLWMGAAVLIVNTALMLAPPAVALLALAGLAG